MRGLRLLVAGLALVGAGTDAEAQGREDGLGAYLARRFQQYRADDAHARFVAAFADLNGDGRPEALVYLIGSPFCGTGGCNLLILTPTGRSWRTVADMSIVNPPVRLLGSEHRRWRDLAVTVAGGGARSHEVLLAFNGRAYPFNPSGAPTLRRPVPGRVLIADRDRGRPLY